MALGIIVIDTQAASQPQSSSAPKTGMVSSVQKTPTPVAPKMENKEDTAFLERFRVSALIDSNRKFRVGLVDSQTGKAYLLSKGDQLMGFVLESMDYQNERIILKKDGARYGLTLKDDPDAIRVVPVSLPPPSALTTAESMEFSPPETMRVKTLKEFLDEHPDLKASEGPRYNFPVTDASGEAKGVTMEEFIQSHPEMKGDENSPTGTVTGLGPGIESVMKDYPEQLKEALRSQETGITQEEALRKMAESTGMPMPQPSTNTTSYEEFLRIHQNGTK